MTQKMALIFKLKQKSFLSSIIVLMLNISAFKCWFLNNEKLRNDLAFKNTADSSPSSFSSINKYNSYNNNNENNNNNVNTNKFNFKPVFSYIGCYNDRRDSRDIGEKDFSYITKFNKTLPTVELCVHLCAKEGLNVAGIQAL
jgi:hypothetical protein